VESEGPSIGKVGVCDVAADTSKVVALIYVN
jgi:hypothetical protein